MKEQNIEHTTARLQELSRSLFESCSSEEISNTLQMMLSVYIQFASVDRLSLANTADITCRMITHINNIEKELIAEEAPLTFDNFI